MKLTIRLLAGLAMAVVLPGMVWAQRNPRGTAQLTLEGKTVSVEYGRPSLNGRSVDQMLSQLNPGEVWRLGADQSTTFTASATVKFGDAAIPKGSYSLWARKEADNSWKLVFNKQHGQWGTDYDSKMDLAAVPLKETKTEKNAEQVSISLAKAGSGGEISISWGNMKLGTNFQ